MFVAIHSYGMNKLEGVSDFNDLGLMPHEFIYNLDQHSKIQKY